MKDICKEVCPCNQCDTEPEDCELANTYIKHSACDGYGNNMLEEKLSAILEVEEHRIKGEDG